MAMTFEADAQAGTIAFLVDGSVTRAEYDAGIAAMDALIAGHGKLAALVEVRSFSGMELAAWWKDVSWGMGHAGKIRRAAIVTNLAWIATAAKAGAVMVPAEVRVFPLAELTAAREWLRA
jgi:hypothetical protein